MSRPSQLVRWTRLLPALVAGIVAVSGAPPATAFTSMSGVRLNSFEARLLTLINKARTSRGIPALAIAPGTTDVARRWAANQAGRNTMSHNPNVARDVEAAGSSNWTRIAENVGTGSGSQPDALFNAYMNSAGHRANILNRYYRYIGLGWAERSSGIGFNTQVFVDQYSTSYGHTRYPAFGGTMDRRSVGATMGVASYENGWDARTLVAATASGISAGNLLFQPPGDGDQGARFTVRQTAAGTGGAGELRVRDALDLSRATAIDVRVGALTGTGRPLLVDVAVRREWGDTVKIGTITVHSPYDAATRLVLPPAARSFRNVVVVSVSRTSLQAIDPASMTGRWASVYVRSLVVVV